MPNLPEPRRWTIWPCDHGGVLVEDWLLAADGAGVVLGHLAVPGEPSHRAHIALLTCLAEKGYGISSNAGLDALRAAYEIDRPARVGDGE